MKNWDRNQIQQCCDEILLQNCQCQQQQAEVQAGVYALKAKKTFAPLGWGKSSETILTLEKIQPFEALLHDLITEILSPNKSFLQNKKGN